jgi:hypothetical protein
MIAEESRLLLDRLEDEALRRIALDRMEGYTTEEIAERLGDRCEQSVKRRASHNEVTETRRLIAASAIPQSPQTTTATRLEGSGTALRRAISATS